MTEKKWKPAVWVLVGYVVADIILAIVTDWMTVSQFCYDVRQDRPWVPVIVGIGFVYLFVHLFWRWKRIWYHFFPK